MRNGSMKIARMSSATARALAMPMPTPTAFCFRNAGTSRVAWSVRAWISLSRVVASPAATAASTRAA